MEDMDHYDIPIYNFPYDPEEDDEETIQDNQELRVRENCLEGEKLKLIILIVSSSFCRCWL
jgi:hypothetical protein